MSLRGIAVESGVLDGGRDSGIVVDGATVGVCSCCGVIVVEVTGNYFYGAVVVYGASLGV